MIRKILLSLALLALAASAGASAAPEQCWKISPCWQLCERTASPRCDGPFCNIPTILSARNVCRADAGEVPSEPRTESPDPSTSDRR